MNKSVWKAMQFVVFGWLLMCSAANARELLDVNLQEQVNIDGESKPLILNGAGIRYKFIFKVYVGALYLPEKQTDANIILQQDLPNRMMMHIVYDEVSREKLIKAWQDGFSENNSEDVLTALSQRLEKFNQMFSTLQKGDEVLLDYLPETGTRVTIRGEDKGIIEGADFNHALLAVWLGKNPVTEELKTALLGVQQD